MKVVVASTNPVKIEAVRLAFHSCFSHGNWVFQGVSVESGVSSQPLTDAQTRLGALNRAKAAAQAMPGADFWVGLEGGIDVLEAGSDLLFSFCWAVVFSAGRMGQSRSANFQLPGKIAELVKTGYELGDADDIVFGTSNSKQGPGSVGLLTHQALTRSQLYCQAVQLALIPFISPELFTELEGDSTP